MVGDFHQELAQLRLLVYTRRADRLADPNQRLGPIHKSACGKPAEAPPDLLLAVVSDQLAYLTDGKAR